ncbi:patatin [Marinibacterium profundimaris]|uniref:Patatin n=1 Tax=Marinibacterium profundimaris TaxID=1679460 RepID=A0A225NXK5_9RHOB|nr:patatin-like phospholipase family protein [Marinibacterium profundimaris]OWU78017.1 patatin [Marinibacterium profundimaris]
MKKRINLALQGGGAHGAYTWGVLDRLLEEPEVEIAGISGTSAGALNGAALKAGMVRGGPEAARENLDWLWSRMGAINDRAFEQWMEGVSPRGIARAVRMSPFYMFGETVARIVSPYAFGPFYTNPLRPIVDVFDYDKVCSDAGPRLYICATNVRSGKIRIFSGEEISTDAILASACLPSIFKAVEIESPETGEVEAYWDGGYTGNPALFPLFDRELPQDIVVININPLVRDAVPVTPQQIQNRINEISFNTSLLREMRAIAFVQRLLDDGTMPQGRMQRVYLHMIADDVLMNMLSEATKLVPTPPLLAQLKAAGRSSAEAFLESHFDDIGARSSVDMVEMFS